MPPRNHHPSFPSGKWPVAPGSPHCPAQIYGVMPLWPPSQAQQQGLGGASGKFTCCGVRGYPWGPPLGQAEHTICGWVVPLPTLTPVTPGGVDAALGTAAPSSTALVDVCRKAGAAEPLNTRPSGGHPRHPARGHREDGNQPHLSGRCCPAILQGSDSGLAGHSSPHSGTVAGILLLRGRPITN